MSWPALDQSLAMVDPIIPAPIMPIRMIRSDAATNRDGSHRDDGTADIAKQASTKTASDGPDNPGHYRLHGVKNASNQEEPWS